MGNDPARDHTVRTVCGPPAATRPTWALDHTQRAERGEHYAARHDGFRFYQSVTANRAFCAAWASG